MALQLFSELELQHGLAIGFPEFAQPGFILLGDTLEEEKGSGTVSSDYPTKQYCITLLGLLPTLYLVPDCGECARSAPHAHQPGNKWYD